MEVGGKLVAGPTKTGRPRTLTLPRFPAEMLGEMLGEHVMEEPKDYLGHLSIRVTPRPLWPPLPEGLPRRGQRSRRDVPRGGGRTSCDQRRR